MMIILLKTIVHSNLRRLLIDLTFLCFLACYASSYHCSSLLIKHISRKYHWANRMDIGAYNYDLGVFGVCAKNLISRELNIYLLWNKKTYVKITCLAKMMSVNNLLTGSTLPMYFWLSYYTCYIKLRCN